MTGTMTLIGDSLSNSKCKMIKLYIWRVGVWCRYSTPSVDRWFHLLAVVLVEVLASGVGGLFHVVFRISMIVLL